MVIVDTTVWVDYLKGRSSRETDWLDREMDLQRLGLTDLILCELLQGVREDARFELMRRQMLAFEVFQTGGIELALEAAKNYRRLRSLGFTVRKTVDCWIATFCLLEGHTLLHADRDYDPFERRLGLSVVHP